MTGMDEAKEEAKRADVAESEVGEETNLVELEQKLSEMQELIKKIKDKN